jgi:hypothetical protein
MRVAGDLFLFYGTCLVRMVTMYLVAHKPLGLQILKLCKVVLLPNTMFLTLGLYLYRRWWRTARGGTVHGS